MGRALASILNTSIAEQVTAERDREAVLVEAAAVAGLERGDLDRLLEEGARELPDEPAVRRLLEAVGVADVGEALNEARREHDRFEGDEAPYAPVFEPNVARLLEAQGPGSRAGTVRYRIVVARPCEGKGTGNRIYESAMLAANATNFGDQPVFFNHEDIGTIIKRGHGSRDPRDLAGYVNETSWDPDYSEPDDATEGYGRGAVIGVADVLQEAADYIDRLPKAVKVSMNMDPTKLTLKRRSDGRMGTLVEGVVKGSGSIDLITGGAGAGGKVLERLREAAKARYAPADHEDLADLNDDRLLEAVRARPALVERLREATPALPPDPEVPVSDQLDHGKLIEAVAADPDAAGRLAEALAGTPVMDRLVEAKVAEREEAIRADAREENQRDMELRDMRDEAHRLIEARGFERGGILTPAFVEDLRERYMLRDGRHPSAALDIYAEVDDDGAVVRSAMERLREAVEADIKREEAKLREAAPTRTRGLTPAPDDPDGEPPKPPEAPKDPLAEELGLDSDRVRQYQGV